jgi:hypothetical protein
MESLLMALEPMTEIPESYANETAFHEFLDREFDRTAVTAPLEDLAQFAFGGVEEAIMAYEHYKAAVASVSLEPDEQ